MIAPAHGWRSWPRTHPSGRNCLTPGGAIFSGSGDGTSDDELLVAELAALPRLQYAKRRKDAAKRLGVTVGELDKIVGEARGEPKGKDDDALYPHWNVEPSENQLRVMLC